MRLVIDVHRDAHGRLEGEIAPQGEQPRPFSGTLDLLLVLEEHTETHTAPRNRANDGSSGAIEPPRPVPNTRGKARERFE